ncbi:hypothetical protein, conserved [Eimeria tenella]|uniref:EF-hand domain-containing protein n=1 Tax=Eimeria tenella TaxID=5802 RepID=U6KN11_EIMTE|nr:hypothetical protein, conserved [Eimeria tenella]CDJ38221.1 hypothetical protein, conserved [Eimeria tenella]|eukprot:XP_013229059.1 hypothetical protein, conserved [Eimeria tenella]
MLGNIKNKLPANAFQLREDQLQAEQANGRKDPSALEDEHLLSAERFAFELADQTILSRAALMAEAFEAVDVNDEGFIRWESITSYLERSLASGRF